MPAQRIPGVTDLYRRLPRNRRLRGLDGFRPKRLLQLRRMVPGADRIPLTVTSPRGLRMRFTRDPLDETIAEDVFGRHHATYFPEVPDGFEPKLVLDLGAHHGQYSLVATLEYPGANVIAVEPGPDQATALRRNVQLNQLDERITVLESALSDASGDAALHLDSDGSWGNTLFEPSGDGGAVTVRTSTLSQILGGRVPDVVKCNAEGAEYALIQQLDSIEPKPGLLVLMVHDEHGDVRALEEAIGMMGYEVNTVMVGDHPTWHCTLDS